MHCEISWGRFCVLEILFKNKCTLCAMFQGDLHFKKNVTLYYLCGSHNKTGTNIKYRRSDIFDI